MMIEKLTVWVKLVWAGDNDTGSSAWYFGTICTDIGQDAFIGDLSLGCDEGVKIPWSELTW